MPKVRPENSAVKAPQSRFDDVTAISDRDPVGSHNVQLPAHDGTIQETKPQSVSPLAGPVQISDLPAFLACFCGSASGARVAAATLELATEPRAPNHPPFGQLCTCERPALTCSQDGSVSVNAEQWVAHWLRELDLLPTIEQLCLDLYAVES